jgi:hypothetical protein
MPLDAILSGLAPSAILSGLAPSETPRTGTAAPCFATDFCEADRSAFVDLASELERLIVWRIDE